MVKGQGHHSQPHVKGTCIINECMCIQLKVAITKMCRNIEVNDNMLKDGRMDG